jgi:hypothetical protein
MCLHQTKHFTPPELRNLVNLRFYKHLVPTGTEDQRRPAIDRMRTLIANFSDHICYGVAAALLNLKRPERRFVLDQNAIAGDRRMSPRRTVGDGVLRRRRIFFGACRQHN